MNKSNVIVAALVALLVSGSVAFLMRQTPSSPLGGRVEPTLNEFSGGIELSNGGTRGSILKLVSFGTCSLTTNGSIAATSTGPMTCAIPGARSGDIVDLNLTATTSLAGQFLIKSSHASTTNGFGFAEVFNQTGAARDPGSVNAFGSSTQYKLWRFTNSL